MIFNYYLSSLISWWTTKIPNIRWKIDAFVYVQLIFVLIYIPLKNLKTDHWQRHLKIYDFKFQSRIEYIALVNGQIFDKYAANGNVVSHCVRFIRLFLYIFGQYNINLFKFDTRQMAARKKLWFEMHPQSPTLSMSPFAFN